MVFSLIRITPETATFLLKDIVNTYQRTKGKYSNTRKYLLYLIFMVNCCKNKWKSVDGSLTVSAVLVAPPNKEEREDGLMYTCRVGYYRDGIKSIDTFSFPVDSFWAKILYQNYSSMQAQSEAEPYSIVELNVSRNVTHLLDIDEIVRWNYGDI